MNVATEPSVDVERLNGATDRALNTGTPTEDALKAQYAKVIRRAAARVRGTYNRRARVLMAAGKPQSDPQLDEIVNADAIAASTVTTTAAARRRLAREALRAAMDGDAWSTFALDRMYEIAGQQAGVQAERMVAEVQDKARATIQQAAVEGWTIPKTAEELQTSINSITDVQATLLARTDLISTANAASHTVAQDAAQDGPPLFKVWLATFDNRTRPDHAVANGQKVGMDEAFNVGGAFLKYPGDPLGPDDETINCRCSLIYSESPVQDDVELNPDQSTQLAKSIRVGNEESSPEFDPRFGLLSDGGNQMADVVTADADMYTGEGGMVALYPTSESAAAMAIENGQPSNDLHLTLAFIPTGEWDQLFPQALKAISDSTAPVEGVVGGYGYFSGDDANPLIALPDLPALPELHRIVTSAMRDYGVLASEEHGYTPHVTLGYDETPGELPDLERVPIVFDRIELRKGGDLVEAYPLGGKEGLMAAVETQEMDTQAEDNKRYADELCAHCGGTGMAEDVTAAAFTQDERDALAKEGVALPDGSFPIRNKQDLSNAIHALGRAKDVAKAKAHIIKRAKALGATDMLPEDWSVTASLTAGCGCGDHEESACQCGTVTNLGSVELYEGSVNDAVVAAVVPPDAPPIDWFGFPELDGPTPLTVTSDGQIYGHFATWDQCHTGFDNKCVTPPKGLTYDFFNVGALETAEGETVKVGKITVGTGHAPITASRAAAASHYDNTGTVGGYVRAGEDQWGPRLAGTVKSDATPEQIRDLMANGPSGDWRRVKAQGRNALELVGVLSVPVQGFPIASLSASGAEHEEVMSLIAGAAYTPVEAAAIDDRVESLAAQFAAAEAVVEPSFDERMAEFDQMLDDEDAAQDAALADRIDSLSLQLDEIANRAAPTVIVNVGEGNSATTVAGDVTTEREAAYRVNFFRTHGYWPQEPQSGVDLTEGEWRQAQSLSSFIVEDPENLDAKLLQARLLDAGWLDA